MIHPKAVTLVVSPNVTNQLSLTLLDQFFDDSSLLHTSEIGLFIDFTEPPVINQRNASFEILATHPIHLLTELPTFSNQTIERLIYPHPIDSNINIVSYISHSSSLVNFTHPAH